MPAFTVEKRVTEYIETIEHIKGYRPEWCISTIHHAWDTSFYCLKHDV